MFHPLLMKSLRYNNVFDAFVSQISSLRCTTQKAKIWEDFTLCFLSKKFKHVYSVNQFPSEKEFEETCRIFDEDAKKNSLCHKFVFSLKHQTTNLPKVYHGNGFKFIFFSNANAGWICSHV